MAQSGFFGDFCDLQPVGIFYASGCTKLVGSVFCNNCNWLDHRHHYDQHEAFMMCMDANFHPCPFCGQGDLIIGINGELSHTVLQCGTYDQLESVDDLTAALKDARLKGWPSGRPEVTGALADLAMLTSDACKN